LSVVVAIVTGLTPQLEVTVRVAFCRVICSRPFDFPSATRNTQFATPTLLSFSFGSLSFPRRKFFFPFGGHLGGGFVSDLLFTVLFFFLFPLSRSTFGFFVEALSWLRLRSLFVALGLHLTPEFFRARPEKGTLTPLFPAFSESSFRFLSVDHFPPFFMKTSFFFLLLVRVG